MSTLAFHLQRAVTWGVICSSICERDQIGIKGSMLFLGADQEINWVTDVNMIFSQMMRKRGYDFVLRNRWRAPEGNDQVIKNDFHLSRFFASVVNIHVTTPWFGAMVPKIARNVALQSMFQNESASPVIQVEVMPYARVHIGLPWMATASLPQIPWNTNSDVITVQTVFSVPGVDIHGCT